MVYRKYSPMPASHVATNNRQRTALTKDLRARIFEKRRQKEFSQAKLAAMVNITQASISQIERGERKQVKESLLQALAESLDTTVRYLLDGGSTEQTVREVPSKLRRTMERIADLPNEQQEEIIEAVEWLISWRYGV